MKVVFVEEAPMAGRESVARPGDTVGRSGSDIELADPEVSRRHAVVRVVDGKPAIEDLGSRNGTYVNDCRVDGITVLAHGDRVRFGRTVWRVRLASGDGARPGEADPAAAN
jgi:pSer/pThr/pTyr-binding forkhead associated (FHA) protein